METPLPAMRGHYSIRNPAANRLLRIMDSVLRLILRRRAPIVLPTNVRRILISNIAHLGDVIMATSVLPALRDKFPDAEFGFLIGSWAVPVLQGHPLVSRSHVLDHWMQTRAHVPFRDKWRVYRRTRAQALREIRAVGYDIAIDLYWNMPNTLPFLWQTGIPIRAGYGSAGFGPLATHCLELSESQEHIADRHKRLLSLLSVDQKSLILMKSSLPPVTADIRSEVGQYLEQTSVSLENYVVLHPGASAGFREWPEEKWTVLAQRLTQEGYGIIFTGYGSAEAAMIGRIATGLTGCLDLCGRLSWQSFVGVIQQARLLVCVDTVAGHVAGAVGTPSAVLTAGRYPYLWKPIGAFSQVLMASVPCAPCHRNYGCAGMECLRGVEVEQVLAACSRLILPLSRSETPNGSVK